MSNKSLSMVIGSAVLLAGCSSKPRTFEPQLSAAPVDSQAYDAALQGCREEAAASIKKGSGRLGSAAGGAAIGAGSGVAAGAAAGAGASSAMFASAAAAAAAMVVVAPIAAIGGAWGISKIKKNKKERTVKAVMNDCLTKSGYSVAGWRVMSKREARALAAKPAAVPPQDAAAGTAAAPNP